MQLEIAPGSIPGVLFLSPLLMRFGAARPPWRTTWRCLWTPAYERLRVEDFRVIFEELEGEVIIIGIGPRSGVYGLCPTWCQPG